jgi:hypothetical protein
MNFITFYFKYLIIFDIDDVQSIKKINLVINSIFFSF